MVNDMAVEAVGLAKSYGKVSVLRRLNLSISRGSIYALLGPNGVGKTTTVRILATLTQPDDGIARVAGFDVVKDPHEVQRRISLTGQYAAVDGAQTGAENLRMMARLFRMPRAAARRRATELLELYGLGDSGDRRVATYSGGMRRRLDLAASMVVRPEVVFLDEPTTGLDLRSRQTMWQVIRDLSAAGITVLLTTQYLEEADQLADRIGVMDRGRLVAEGTAAELKSQIGGQRLELVMADGLAFRHILDTFTQEAISSEAESLSVTLPTDGSAARVRDLLDRADPMRTLVSRFAVHAPTLDDVFLALTGRTADTETEKEKASV